MGESAQFLGGTGGKIGPKGEIDPISLGLEEEILQFLSETIEHPLHFSDDQFAPLNPKISNKIKTKPVFLDQFCTVPSTFRLSLPKIIGQVCYFITPPYQFCC